MPFITGYNDGTWYDKDHKAYEWHLDDPMRLRDILIWRICQSEKPWVQHIGWDLWESLSLRKAIKKRIKRNLRENTPDAWIKFGQGMYAVGVVAAGLAAAHWKARRRNGSKK